MGDSTGTIIGAGLGALATIPTGGAVNPWVGASMGAAIGGGIDARSVSYSNARARRTAAQYNYQKTIRDAEYNNRIEAAITGVNNAALMAGATASAGITRQIAAYNANLKRQVADHNAELLEHEAELVYQAAELDEDQFIRAANQQQGAMKAAYGASGVIVDDPRDTPAQRLMDAEIEEELEVSIIRHNADIQASKLLLGAATSRWEGELAARQILFEGFSSANLTMTQAASRAIGNAGQSALNQAARSYNARSQAHEIMVTGNWDANQYEQAGDRAFMRGLFSAGSTYANYKAYQADQPVAPKPKPRPPQPSAREYAYQSSLLADY